MVTTIFMPRHFDRDDLPPLFEKIEAARSDPRVIVDFSRLVFSCPTAMLVVGSKLREWVMQRHRNGLSSQAMGIDGNIAAHSYLMHLGFFKFIYMDDGKEVGQARGSSRYLPITKIGIPAFDPARTDLQHWHATIVEESRNLAGVLAGTYDDSEELRIYSYSIREIIRNVFEHSGAKECFVCGQRWRDGRVEIAIIDEGVGVANTLSQAYEMKDDAEALLMALKPGISRTNSLPDEDNVYENSGFGLYVLSSLAASFGWFAFGSGSARVIGHSNTARISQPFSFAGTFFGIRLSVQPRNFRSLLDDIIQSGEEEANMEGVRRKASGLSKII